MRCFLLVSKENGVWTDVSIGYTYLARAWDKINQAWPQRNIVLIDVAWLNSYYFHIPDVNSTNLTLIQPTPENPEVGLAKISAEYSVLQTNVESISNLKNIMNKGR